MGRKRKRKQKKEELVLDAIYNSNDPEVGKFMQAVMCEEMQKSTFDKIGEAFDRATIRIAWQFKDKLTPDMQNILQRDYPLEAVVA